MTRIDLNAALSSSIWQPRQGSFPCHPHGQRRHFSQRHVLMVPEPALGRPTCGIMLDPVSVEDANGAIVHADRERHQQ